MPALALKLEAITSRVGDFSVRRALPQRERRFVGPFCFLDHMGPHTAVGGPKTGVGAHPHIGLATVTYLFEGEALHRDTLGSEQLIRPGDVNLMTAGRGIAHAERTPAALWNQPAAMHGLQCWIGLPLAEEDAAPTFQHVAASALPRLDVDGVEGSVVLGTWSGLRSPVKVSSPMFYVVAQVSPGASVDIPSEHPERAIYVAEGEVLLDGESLTTGTLAVLTPGVDTCITAVSSARIALLGGAPLDGPPRRIWWNFVSSRQERIDQAKVEWREGAFGSIVGEDEPRMKMPGENK